MKIYNFIFVSIALILGSAVMAGQDRGGGLVFYCRSETGNQDSVHLVDLYRLSKDVKWNAIRRFKLEVNESQALMAILDSIKEADPILADQLMEGMAKLQYVERRYLPLIGDDDVDDTPYRCKKLQLGVQYLGRDIVEYDPDLFDRLTGIEKAFFKLHEAYIRIYQRNSLGLRDRVESVANSSALLERLGSMHFVVWIDGLARCDDSQILNLDSDLIGEFKYKDRPVSSLAVHVRSYGIVAVPTIGYFVSKWLPNNMTGAKDRFAFTINSLAENNYCLRHSLQRNDDQVAILRVEIVRKVKNMFMNNSHVYEYNLTFNKVDRIYAISYRAYASGRGLIFQYDGSARPVDAMEEVLKSGNYLP
jgi:hypothetical protein